MISLKLSYRSPAGETPFGVGRRCDDLPFNCRWVVPVKPQSGQADAVKRPKPDAAHRSLKEDIKARVNHERDPIRQQKQEQTRPMTLAHPAAPNVSSED